MKLRNVLTLVAAVALSASLAGCGGAAEPAGGGDVIGGDVIAPVTMSVNELQGETVELVVGQVLNITTESLAVDSYRGEVSDPEVATFTPGKKDGSAEFNPGVTALAEGSAEVTMTNEQGGIQSLEFTVRVSSTP